MAPVRRRGKVGFLMLFEWYLNAEVGDFLKNPECPVWVICSESHYTVLFTDEAGRASRMECPFR